MKKRIVIIFILLFSIFSGACFAQKYTFSGTITDKTTGDPVEFATVVLEGPSLWAVADASGRFTITGVPSVKTTVSVSCLGYVEWKKEIQIGRDIKDFKVALAQDNLSLESAVVTAQEDANSATTARTIDKTALDHVQVMNVSDISALLPGGATKDPSLTSDQQIAIRAGSGENGSAAFGTAIEVDGVRLSNNASFTNSSLSGRSGSVAGASTNNLASSNIESVEVITGVPSVEYGDMSSGVVKINTRKGKTPWIVTMSTSPKTKQVSLSKGFGLGIKQNGASRGVLNASAEYTRSVSEPMSPYTSYDRKQLSLTYSNLFNRGSLHDIPLRLTASIAGNLGGLDNRADPDKMIETFTIHRDNSLRANFNLNWLLSKSWITNLELNASAVYSDKMQRENSNYHSSTTTISLHTPERGYYIATDYDPDGDNAAVLIPKGNRYNVMALDDRPLSTKVTLKATWAKNIGNVNNKLKVGADWNTDKNFGIGEYTEDMSTAPSYREWRFCDVPAMHNIGIYAEDNFLFTFGRDSRLNFIAGVRNDNTLIQGSAYGTTSSVSPRFNAKYTAFTPKTRGKKFLRELSMRASWGVAVKQPSFAVLYPTPSYFDINVFKSTADANNVVYEAYYVMPRTIEYNTALRWQRNRQAEIGLDMDLGGNRISLVAFRSLTIDGYNKETTYEPFSYNLTTAASVQGMEIPAEDRLYIVNPVDGTITVSDRTGAHSPVLAPYKTINQFVSRYTEDNDDNPVKRYGLEWIIDFKRIKSLNTDIRFDGSYYNYKSVYTDLTAYCPSAVATSDGLPYKYVGWYVGGNSNSNGTETSNVKANLTVTTHIPKVRMILSVKLEASLYRYSRYLSENPDGSERSKLISDRADMLSFADGSIYDGPRYSVTWPDYYSSIDNPDVKIPFGEALLAAKQEDALLYSDLSKLVVPNTTYNHTYLEDRISPYFSANVSVTKEIGDLASISFYANNFFNNMAQVYSTKTGTWSSTSNYIPKFYYGLTLRLKFN
jgi:hypothetical protein